MLSGELAWELAKRGLIPADAELGTIFWADGYGFTSHGYTVATAIEVEQLVDGRETFVGYNVIVPRPASASPPPGRVATAPGGGPAAGSGKAKPVPTKPPATKPETAAPPPKKAGVQAKQAPLKKPPASTPATPPAGQAPKPVPDDPEQVKAELDKLPPAILDLLQGTADLPPGEHAHLLKIARKLEALKPEDLVLYKLVAKRLVKDLDAFDRSIDFFVAFKNRIAAEAAQERKKETESKELSLEAQLAKSWDTFDEKRFKVMDAGEREDLARKIAGEQRDIQLRYMASHPGKTALGMVEGVVRVDKAAAAIVDDVREAANGDKNAYSRIAGGVGALNKTIGTVASLVFIGLLFVPGVNLVEMAMAGFVVAVTTITLSLTESELRIKAASEAKSPEDFKLETEKSGAAQATAWQAAAMMVLTVAAKMIARTPLPGRYRNVGAALRAAQTGLLEKTGIGPGWQAIKTEVLAKLKGSKAGLTESLADQAKIAADTAKSIEPLSGEEFLKKLADGDPKLAEVGIPAEQAKGLQQAAKTPEGSKVAEQLRRETLKALQDAPAEATQKMKAFTEGVDRAVDRLEKAQTAEQLKAAVDDASKALSEEEQAKRAVVDEEGYIRKRAAEKEPPPAAPKAKIIDRSVPGERYFVVDSENSKFYAEGSVYRRELSISLRTELPEVAPGVPGPRSTVIKGSEQFAKILNYFKGGFDAIRGNWTYGSNLAKINELTATGMPLKEAAAKTWTGINAEAVGFKTVEVVGTPVGSPGAYTEVQVLFRK